MVTVQNDYTTKWNVTAWVGKTFSTVTYDNVEGENVEEAAQNFRNAFVNPDEVRVTKVELNYR